MGTLFTTAGSALWATLNSPRLLAENGTIGCGRLHKLAKREWNQPLVVLKIIPNNDFVSHSARGDVHGCTHEWGLDHVLQPPKACTSRGILLQRSING